MVLEKYISLIRKVYVQLANFSSWIDPVAWLPISGLLNFLGSRFIYSQISGDLFLSVSGDNDLGNPPPCWKNPGKTRGGFLTPTSRAQILDPKMDHFLKRFPLSNAPNTQNFPPAAGQNPASTKSADLTKQRGGFLWRGVSQLHIPWLVLPKLFSNTNSFWSVLFIQLSSNRC